MKVRFIRVHLAVVGWFLASAVWGGELLGHQQAGKESTIARGARVERLAPKPSADDVWSATPTGIVGVWSVSAIQASEPIPAVFFWAESLQPYGQRRDFSSARAVHDVSLIQGTLQLSNGATQPIVAVLISSIATGETKLVRLQAFEEATAAKAYFRNFQRRASIQGATVPPNTRWSCLDCRAVCDTVRDEGSAQCSADFITTGAIIAAFEAACLAGCRGNIPCMGLCAAVALEGLRQANETMTDCLRINRLEWTICVDACGEIAY